MNAHFQRRSTIAGVAVAVLCAFVRAQQAPTRDSTVAAPPRAGSGMIAGTVIEAGSGAPVRRATVVAVNQGDTPGFAGGRLSVTDDAGRFALRGLPAGRYMVSATKPAYLPTAFGVTKPMRSGNPPTGTAINLADGQRLDGLSLQITRGSVVAGTVRGPDGRPVRGVSVSLAYALRAPLTGDRTLALLQTGGATTDARGEYRIYGAPSGEYIVSARISFFTLNLQSGEVEATTDADLRRIAGQNGGGANPPSGPGLTAPAARRPTYGYAPVFHPGTTMLSAATALVLMAGEERSGIDFQMQLVPQSRITGVVTGPDGRPAENVGVRLTNASPYAAGPFLTSTNVFSTAQGQYVMRGIPAGDYIVEVRPGVLTRGGQPPLTSWARVPVSVAPGVDMELNIALQPGRTLTGRVSIEPPAAGPLPDFSKARVSLMNRDGLTTSATTTATGQFTFAGLVPEAYRFVVSMPTTGGATPLVVKSATIGGLDALDAMVDVADDAKVASIVLTDRASELSGAILDGAGRPAPDYTVIVFPADKALWSWQSRRIQQQRPSHDGKFVFRNLPAGEYLLGAVTDVEPNQWFEPAFLSELVGGSVKVTLGDGDKKVQEIRLR